MDFDALYAILAAVARTPNGLITYGQLSHLYLAATGVDLPPHGSWDTPLGQLNTMLHTIGWAPLSAVVALQTRDGGFGEPGGGFWESSPNIPARPADPDVRTAQWGQLLQQVYDAPWPVAMPIAPPR